MKIDLLSRWVRNMAVRGRQRRNVLLGAGAVVEVEDTYKLVLGPLMNLLLKAYRVQQRQSALHELSRPQRIPQGSSVHHHL